MRITILLLIGLVVSSCAMPTLVKNCKPVQDDNKFSCETLNILGK